MERVGGRKTITLDVRVIATTNRDLADFVREGRFREDLYYRLSVFPMHWQPLRERPLDILPMATSLLKKHCRKMKLTGVSFATDARNALMQHGWPGNVRELDNAIQRSLVLHQGNVIHAEDLCLVLGATGRFDGHGAAGVISVLPPAPEPIKETYSHNPEQSAASALNSGVAEVSYPDPLTVEAGSLGNDLRQQEFRIIIQALKSERGRRNKAAEQLGISPRTLRYKLAQMREAGIDLDAELAMA